MRFINLGTRNFTLDKPEISPTHETFHALFSPGFFKIVLPGNSVKTSKNKRLSDELPGNILIGSQNNNEHEIKKADRSYCDCKSAI